MAEIGLPTGVSIEPFLLFLKTEGVGAAFMNSLGAALITVVLSLLLGAPAGYALARYTFAGKDTYRLLVLLTRAFPLAILALPLTVSFIRLGLYDTVIGVGLVHTVLALPFAALVTQGIFLGVPRELEEAAWVFGCSRIEAFLQDRRASGLARRRRHGGLCLRHLVERGLCGFGSDGQQPNADGLSSDRAVREPAALPLCRRSHAHPSVRRLHLRCPALPVRDLGHFQQITEFPMANIVIDSIRKSFGGFEALKDVSLVVGDGEFVSLLGPSGCGKTTLLRIIAGLETETSGKILIGGKPVNGLAPKDRGLAMVFQNYAVFPHMTVFENVAFGLRMQKADAKRIKTQVEKAAGLLHIEPYLDRYPNKLSGGQRQRVAVARALAVEPQVLLMDEPLSNLDALLRLEMRTELKSVLQASGTTTIYVTHDQTEAMGLSDRIAVMYNGRIEQVGPPVEIYSHPATRFVGGFMGNPPMNFIKLPVANGRVRLGSRDPRRPARRKRSPPRPARRERLSRAA